MLVLFVSAIVLASIGPADDRGRVIDNPYWEFLQLQKDAEKISVTERRKQAQLVSEKMFNYYRRAERLQFTEETSYYWCASTNARACRQPMTEWPAWRWIATARLDCSPRIQAAEIFAPAAGAGEKKIEKFIYSLSKSLNPAVGMQKALETPANLDGETICAIGIHRNWWIGSDAHEPEILRQKIADGEWLGVARGKWFCGGLCEEFVCDVVRVPWRDDPWVFFVTERGQLKLWLKIESFKQKGSVYDTLIRAKSYSYYNLSR